MFWRTWNPRTDSRAGAAAPLDSKVVGAELSVQDELDRRLTIELGQRARLGGFTYPVLMGVIAVNTELPREFPALFWSCFALLLGGSVWRTVAARRAMAPGDDFRGARRMVRLTTLVLLGAWSVMLSVGLYHYSHGTLAVMMVFAIAGFTSVGASVFAPDPELSSAYALLHMVPAVLWSWWVKDVYGWMLTAILLAFWFFVWLLNQRSNAHLTGMTEAQILLERNAAELRAARDVAEEASRARSAFLANMSHEIRTPLNGVLGVAELLGEMPLSEEQSELVEMMRKSGVHLRSVVNDILDISKINAGKLRLEKERFRLREALEDVLGPLRLTAKAKGLALNVEIDPALPAAMLGDAVRLRQLVLNLAGNAVKFTETGKVDVRARRIGESQMLVEVEDTGVGIPAEKIGTIFDAFEQADSSTTRRYGGTGLGLAICKRLVDMLGGELGLESSLGKGSRFWFSLPLTGVEAEAEPVKSGGGITGLRVLVAEDNAVNQRVVAALLTKMGASVQLAVNGNEAVEMAKSGEFDIVLMDCQMPVLDGFEATRQIRKLPGATAQVPVVALTANQFDEVRDECFAAGMNAHLRKPILRDELVKVLEGFAGRV
jgi:signal transduction histidine kinase/CheY-like chemotaxis protein